MIRRFAPAAQSAHREVVVTETLNIDDYEDLPRRSDARRNYDALVEAATITFAEGVEEVPLEEIARSAGVGIGTLYRHFPSRDSLVLAIYRREVQDLVGTATELRDALTPFDAFAAWAHRYIAAATTTQSVRGALRAMYESNPELFSGVRALLLQLVDGLLAPAVSEGSIRPDVEAEDILRVLGGICMVTDRHDGQDRAQRMLRLVLDGLRLGARPRTSALRKVRSSTAP